jgi:hypothetical protein
MRPMWRRCGPATWSKDTGRLFAAGLALPVGAGRRWELQLTVGAGPVCGSGPCLWERALPANKEFQVPAPGIRPPVLRLTRIPPGCPRIAKSRGLFARSVRVSYAAEQEGGCPGPGAVPAKVRGQACSHSQRKLPQPAQAPAASASSHSQHQLPPSAPMLSSQSHFQVLGATSSHQLCMIRLSSLIVLRVAKGVALCVDCFTPLPCLPCWPGHVCR